MEQNQKLTIPLKTRIALSVISTFTDTAQRTDGTINRRFLNLFDFPAPPNPKPTNTVSSTDHIIDPSRNLWFRLYTPHNTTCTNIPVIIFFHGGGFAFLSPNTYPYDSVCRRFARKLTAYVISVNYRLAPEHRFPSQYDDGFDVLKYLDDKNNNIIPENADLSRCFLAGDSAGGNIAHNVTLRVSKESFVSLKVIGLVSIQPFFGGEGRTEAEVKLVGMPLVSPERTDWCWKALLPEGSDRDHVASNPKVGDVSGVEYPDTMVVVAGFDPLKDWQKGYYEWLKANGKRVRLVEYPTMFHAFYIFPELPESGQLVQRIKEFVDECVASLSG